MLNVFIATANQDKFNRISRWFSGLDVKITGPHDLPDDVANETKITDEEEKSFGSMTERAKGKAAKAANALQGLPYLIIAMDDTAYFPLLDMEINDLRTPPAIILHGTEIVPATQGRLQGIDLANYYARLTDLVVKDQTEEMRSLGYKFMPIVWRFAIAVVDKGGAPQIIGKWERQQFLRNTILTEAISDTGYMMDRVISDTPDGEVNVYRKGTHIEKVPYAAIRDYLKY